MRGWGWEKVRQPDHAQRVVECVSAAWVAGHPFELTFPLGGQDRQCRWFLTRAAPIRNEADELVRWLGTNTDVTNMRRLQERLEDSYADLEAKITFRNLELEYQARALKQRLGE